MSTFNFSFHKCCLCGNITDDGSFCGGSKWVCLDCLDLLSDYDVPF